MTEQQAETLANQLRISVPTPRRHTFEIEVSMYLPEREFITIVQAERLDEYLLAWLLQTATVNGCSLLLDANGISNDDRKVVKVIFYEKRQPDSKQIPIDDHDDRTEKGDQGTVE
jgi:hypothetical protein